MAASRWSWFLGLPPDLDRSRVLGKGACLLLELCPAQLPVMSDLQLPSQQAELQGCAWHLNDTSVTIS